MSSAAEVSFIDGEAIERYFQTTGGLLWMAAKVAVADRNVRFAQLTLYPATSARARVPVADLLTIFRSLGVEAEEAGFASYTVEAVRRRKGRERIIVFTRSL